MNSLNKFFNPGSIAVIGASREQHKLGYMVLNNIISGGYQGSVYPINPNAESILGKTCFPTVSAVPGEIDLAVVLIPAKFVVEIVKQCVDKGVKGIVIISAGFGEAGDEGKIWEKQIQELSKTSGTRILGPNCLGFINPKVNLNASFGKIMPKKGPVGFISQSGAFGTAMLDWAAESEIGFDLFISIGNKVDINENDILEYWIENGIPTLTVGYLEDIRGGKKFVDFAKKITAKSPFLVLKPGRTEAAQQAIKSHTGALAGSDKVVSTALAQAGCLRVDGMHDLFDLVRLFANEPLLSGDRIAIVTNAGGPAVMTTDFIEEEGMKVARFTDETRKMLSEKLPRESNILDPVDVIGDALADRYGAAIDAVLGDPGVDGLIVLLTPQVMTQIDETASHIARLADTHKKCVCAAFVGGKFVGTGRKKLESLGIPVYHYPDRAVKAFAGMNKYRQYLALLKSKETLGSASGVYVDVSKRTYVESLIRAARVDGRDTLTPSEGLKVVEYYGIKIPKARVASDEDDAVRIAEEIGYPVVLKISTDKILHKTELHGVLLNIKGESEVMSAYRQLVSELSGALKIQPEAVRNMIEVQEQLTGGFECVVGIKKDPEFGHLILFGSGGIFTELYKDVSTRIAPVSKSEALEMIEDTKAAKVMNGFRGLPKRDVNSVAETIERISILASHFPEISELDINPLIVKNIGEECYAVDVKIKIETY